MPDFSHMRTQLVRPARHRDQRHPAGPLAGLCEGRIIGGRTLGAFGCFHVFRVDAVHLFALTTGAVTEGFDQPEFDRPVARMRDARDRSPVNLAGFAMAERRCQRGGNRPCPRHDQHARGVFIQPMHKARLFIKFEHQSIGKRVDVAVRLTRPALHRQPRRFVQRDDVIVAIDHTGPDKLGISL